MVTDIFLIVLIPLLVLLGSIAINIILWERDKRLKVEQELAATRKSFKESLESTIYGNDIKRAKIAYVAYFVPRTVYPNDDVF